MIDNTDSILTALGRLGTQITTLADQLGTRLDRSEAFRIQKRIKLMACMDQLQDTVVRRGHDGTRAELGTIKETISLLVKRIRLLETDVRTRGSSLMLDGVEPQETAEAAGPLAEILSSTQPVLRTSPGDGHEGHLCGCKRRTGGGLRARLPRG